MPLSVIPLAVPMLKVVGAPTHQVKIKLALNGTTKARELFRTFFLPAQPRELRGRPSVMGDN